MSDTLRLVIAIAVILFLLATFIVTFILYKRTPAPKGCENMGPNKEKCKNCEMSCHLNIYADRKENE